MNRRNDAAHAAVDPNVAAALAYRPPARTVQPPQEPTFPPLDSGPEDFGTQPGTRPGTHGNTVVLTCGTDLNPEPVRWLWQHWLALGKLHILAGAPGQGKTTLALTMAATVTIGGQWPDKTRCDAGNVLIWSGEDDPADTLLPRLLAAGAERARCFFIEGARTEDGEVQPFDPARDLQALLLAIQRIGGVRLLVIDPVVSAVTGDSHKNTEVRRALQPLVNLATACDCAVLGITHFAKGGQGVDPAQRVVGSVAFTAVARVVLVAAKVKSLEDGQDARILARSKSNIGPDDGGFTYHLEQCEPLPGIQASRIAWGVAMQGSARDLLTDPNEEQDGEALDVAGFLRGLLADGPMSAKAIFKDADGAGYSRDQVKRASNKLGVEKRKTGMDGGWQWALSDAEESTKGAKGARSENMHPSHSSALPSAEIACPAAGPREAL
ncbi:AAA family ATPase [Delftia tsuruhatensis]|uniref:AAA family ATPase n=1 Tax=Delftia tsuruhatensis TaxID=180282 RepID=UPI0031E0985E